MGQECDYKKVFTEDISDFLKLRASAIGTNIGYYAMCVLTTICYLLSSNFTKINVHGELKFEMNLFSIFVGPPSTGKSPTFKDAITHPLLDKVNLISNATSSGLKKLLSTQQKVFMANPEIYEYLNRMLRNDDENGDCQFLCKLFSNER